MYRGESLVSFLCKHDVIKIGLKQKGNVLCVIQPTMLQRSVCMIFDARYLDTCSKLSATFVPFSFLSLIRPHTIKVASTSRLSFSASHVTKNTRLSMPAQLQCSCSRAWEPGNEANILYLFCSA